MGAKSNSLKRLPLFSLLSFSFLIAGCQKAPGGPVPVDSTTGTCPVCRMTVKAEDPWATEIIYSDGTKLMFESPADMLTFYTGPGNYMVPDAYKDHANVDKILIKDYNSRTQMDARQARLVYKSKVVGPMGPDFIAFRLGDEAEAFAGSNGGTVVNFNEVTAEMIRSARKK